MASIICRYKDGTDTICYSTSRLNDIKVNGTSIGLTTTYNVNSTDVVEFDVNYYSGTASYGENLFFNNQNLVSIELGNGITYVGTQMCAGCTSLQELKVGSSVINFFDWAFRNCTSLSSIDFTEATSLLAIGQQVFQNCTSLTTIDFPDTLNNIKPQAFRNCTSLTSISFGGDIVKMFDYVFSGCTSLNRIDIDAVIPPTLGTEVFANVQYGGDLYYPLGANYNEWLNPDNYYSLGQQGWNGYEVDNGVVVEKCKVICTYQPQILNGGSIDSIPLIPDNILNSGYVEWVKKNGTIIYETGDDISTLWDTPTTSDVYEFQFIGTSGVPEKAFYSDTGGAFHLLTVELVGVTAIGAKAFYLNSELQSVDFGDDLKTIGSGAFGYCSSLLEVDFPNTLTTIGSGAFSDCDSIRSVVIPDNVTNLGSGAFSGCDALTGVTIGSGIEEILDSTFIECSISSITFGENVSTIGENAFQRNSFITLTIPDNITYIGETAFANNTMLTTVNIGSGCTTIGNFAFQNCTLLDRIDITSPSCSVESWTFHNVKKYGLLTYPEGSNYSDWLSTSKYYLGYYEWNKPIFLLDYNSITADASGETLTVGYETHNTTGTFTYTVPDWITITDLGGVFEVTVAENRGNRRNYSVIITLGDVSQSLLVTQLEREFSFELTTTQLDLDLNAYQGTVGYTATDVDSIEVINNYSDWVTITQGDGYFNVSVKANTGTSRKALIYFRANPQLTNYIEDILVINQAGPDPKFELDYNSVTVPQEGTTYGNAILVGYTMVNVWADITYTGPSWVTVGIFDDVISLTVGINSSNYEREGTIVFTAGDYRQTFTIIQEGLDSLSFNIEKNTINAPASGITETVGYAVTGNLNVTVYQNTVWQWVHPSIKDGYVEIVIDRNDYFYSEPREGTIQLQATNGVAQIYKDIYITQAADNTGGGGEDPDDPDNPTNPDNPTVNTETKTIVFEASGGTQPVDFTWSNVSYDDISTKAEAADSWVELDYDGVISTNPVKTQYLVTAGVNTGAPRTTYFVFTGSTSTGEVGTATITIYQKNNEGELPDDSDMSTGCYINLDYYEYTFPATGGTYVIGGYFGYPGTNGMKTRVSSGAVYPILWCTTELLGGGIEDDGTEGNEIWRITMSENTGAAREATIRFSYTNSYGESTSVSFAAKQEAAENSGDEGTTAKVDTFTSSAKVKADGTPEISSFTSIKCGYNEVTILTPTVNGSWITLGAGGTVSGTFIGYDEVRQYPISFAANEGDVRTGTITFSGTDASGNTLISICYITQAAAETGGDDENPEIPVAGDEYIGPIWKDIEYSFGGAEMVEYGIYSTYKTSVGNSIVDVDTLLFAGRSYRRPTDGENSIYVNKICQSYMDAPLLSEENINSRLGYGIFKLKSGDGTTTYRTYRFVNDWSYSDDFRTGLLSRPILNDNTKVFRNQWLPFTVFGANDTVNIPYGIQYGGKKDEYGVTIPDWNSTVSITNGVTTEMFPYPSRKDGAVSYTINGITYPIVDECVQYVLYYVNPWGGYDWFPIRGKVVERDLMTAYTYMQNYDNQTIEFGKKKYLADIRKQFTLHTQWMSEEESSRMWYLLQSNTVYLHNLVEDKIYPAVITNTEQEHKKRLRGQRISYQIDVELSQTRQRI